MAEATIPMGKSKGTPLSQADEQDLKWCLDFARKAVDDPEKANFKARNETFVVAVEKELTRRATGGKQAPKPQAAPQPQSAAMAVRPGDPIVHVEGSYAEPDSATAALRAANARFHLVAPSPVCGSMPVGCEMALSVVLVDPNHETYPITGNRNSPKPTDTVGLSKVALEKIAAAAGVTWIPHLTGRLDNGSDPRYVHYRATAQFRSFDGQILTRQGEVEIDMRDGSDQVEEIRAKARKRSPPETGDSQLLEVRKFILRHAESKAKCRAIASVGIRRSYQRSELDKGFAVAKVMFTGRTKDPAARRMFQEKIADSFLQGSASLYGAPQAPQLPQVPAPPGHAPPTPSYDYDQRTYDVDYEQVPESESSPRPQPQQTQQPDKNPSTPPPADPAKVEPKPDQKLEGLPTDQDRGTDPNQY